MSFCINDCVLYTLSKSQLCFWIVEHILGAIIFQSVAVGLSSSPWEDEWLWGVQFIPSDELSRVHWKLLFIYIWWSTAVRWLGEFFTLSKWQVKQVGTPPWTGERSKPIGRGEGAKHIQQSCRGSRELDQWSKEAYTTQVRQWARRCRSSKQSWMRRRKEAIDSRRLLFICIWWSSAWARWRRVSAFHLTQWSKTGVRWAISQTWRWRQFNRVGASS